MVENDHEQISCANLLKVLADETRLAVVRQLMDGPKHVGEINESLGLEQSLLSHHLKTLREAGLVIGDRDGKAVLYSLAPEFKGSRMKDAINLGCCLISFES
ncbi:ArsR/SmtB family transcription factor [Gimesia aquarii]|uniref:HTH-type transcriptional regulator NmtR n=1 Tax=Gimesia aquarii TaxID=2527964 RepID=A0A517VNX7_9PLAN|nr:metalloregulator ArsR/SmtB family transcription factor [Gimesia aquarii]QDT94610.1 HTH-type transcriptional regulator NmtR [Gimesia aquarii]